MAAIASTRGDHRSYGALMADLSLWPATEHLSTHRLELEPLQVGHAAEMAVALDDAALHTYTGGQPASAGQLAVRYARQVAGGSQDGRQRWCNWVIRQRVSARAIGYVQATIESSQHGMVAEVAWVLAVPAQGSGLATEAATAMLTWLRGHGVQRVTAHVHPNHAASAGVARHLGLTPTHVIIDGEVRWVR